MGELNPPRPLAEADARDAFDCGRESLNAWFRRHAWANHTSGVSRVEIVADAPTKGIVGYYTLCAAQIERAFLPKPQQRNTPEAVPAFLLGQLAVDRTWQGRGVAADLLGHALRRAVAASELIGAAAVVTHPIDERVRGFYAQWGFQDLPFDPRRAMVVRMRELGRQF